MEHAQASGLTSRGSRQARAGDLRAEVRVDTDSDYAGRVLTRNSTTCADFPWRQFACFRVGVRRRSQRWIDFAWCQKHDD